MQHWSKTLLPTGPIAPGQNVSQSTVIVMLLCSLRAPESNLHCSTAKVNG
jgi:hypothetical protein